MPRIPFRSITALALAFALGCAASASAQGVEDDDAALNLAEPDFGIVNLPTTLRLPKFRSNFHLAHRFNGNLRQDGLADSLDNLFGLDQGASVGFEYRFGVARRLQAIAARTNIDKSIQLSAQYDAVHRTGSIAISALAAVEGERNFRARYSPSIGAVVGRTAGERIGMYAVPVWSHRPGVDGGAGSDTFVLGLGARVRLSETVYVVGEMSPRLAGVAPGDPELAFGIEKRAGGHVFQLTVANTHGITFGQLAQGGLPGSLYLGFNLARKFFYQPRRRR
ncbi:MAG: hypothetical protein IT176_01670 [Acidobacteria bacterium]|nr:hypothetical protein [Acidobacteriota bacterium]